MKKGIVMELHQHYTIIMTSEGSFQKAIPIKGAVIGKEVVFQPLKQKRAQFFFYPRRRLSSPLHLLVLTCILLLLVVPFYFLVGEEETYAYVNVDINPSIELKVDAALNVKSVKALNKEGIDIVDGLTGYQHKHIENVIEMIIQESVDTGLINEGKNMLVGVSYAAEDEEDNATIQDHLKKYFTKADPSWKIASLLIPKNIREKAKERNKPMNEVMASTITKANKSNELNDKEKEIINSFYNTESEEQPKNKNDQHDKNDTGKNKNNQGLNINESNFDKDTIKEKKETVKVKDQKPHKKHKENKQPDQKKQQQKQPNKQEKKTEDKQKQRDHAKKEKKKKNPKGKHNSKDHYKKNKQNHNNFKDKDKSTHKHNNHKKNNKHKEKNKHSKHDKDKHKNHKR